MGQPQQPRASRRFLRSARREVQRQQQQQAACCRPTGSRSLQPGRVSSRPLQTLRRPSAQWRWQRRPTSAQLRRRPRHVQRSLLLKGGTAVCQARSCPPRMYHLSASTPPRPAPLRGGTSLHPAGTAPSRLQRHRGTPNWWGPWLGCRGGCRRCSGRGRCARGGRRRLSSPRHNPTQLCLAPALTARRWARLAHRCSCRSAAAAASGPDRTTGRPPARAAGMYDPRSSSSSMSSGPPSTGRGSHAPRRRSTVAMELGLKWGPCWQVVAGRVLALTLTAVLPWRR